MNRKYEIVVSPDVLMKYVFCVPDICGGQWVEKIAQFSLQLTLDTS